MKKHEIRERFDLGGPGSGNRGHTGGAGGPGNPGGSSSKGAVGSGGEASFTTSYVRQYAGQEKKKIDMTWTAKVGKRRVWNSPDVDVVLFTGNGPGVKQQVFTVRGDILSKEEVKSAIEGTATRMPIQLRTDPAFADKVLETAKEVLGNKASPSSAPPREIFLSKTSGSRYFVKSTREGESRTFSSKKEAQSWYRQLQNKTWEEEEEGA